MGSASVNQAMDGVFVSAVGNPPSGLMDAIPWHTAAASGRVFRCFETPRFSWGPNKLHVREL